MTDDRLSGRMHGWVEATIDSGAVVSDGVWLQARPILGLLVPALNGTTPLVNLEISIDGSNYYDLLDAAGSQGVEIAAGTAPFFLSSDYLSPVAGYVGKHSDDHDEILVRLVADATQTADRDFTWLMIA